MTRGFRVTLWCKVRCGDSSEANRLVKKLMEMHALRDLSTKGSDSLARCAADLQLENGGENLSRFGLATRPVLRALNSFTPSVRIELAADVSGSLMITREQAAAILLEERLSLTAYVLTIVRSFHLAEDIFQDTCVKSLLHAEPFETRAQLLKWARVVCKNRAIDVIRSRDGKYRGLSDEVLESLLAGWSDEEPEETSETLDVLADCLDELTSNNRKILQLRYFEGRSGIDVANILGRKPATVYQALARIHNMLERCIQMRLALSGGES